MSLLDGIDRWPGLTSGQGCWNRFGCQYHPAVPCRKRECFPTLRLLAKECCVGNFPHCSEFTPWDEWQNPETNKLRETRTPSEKSRGLYSGKGWEPFRKIRMDGGTSPMHPSILTFFNASLSSDHAFPLPYSTPDEIFKVASKLSQKSRV